jgi:hypothetical protein
MRTDYLLVALFNMILANNHISASSMMDSYLSSISASNFSDVLAFASNGGRRWLYQPGGLHVAKHVKYFTSFFAFSDQEFSSRDVYIYGTNILSLALIAASDGWSVVAIETKLSQDITFALRELNLSFEQWQLLIAENGIKKLKLIVREKFDIQSEFQEHVSKASVIVLRSFHSDLTDLILASDFRGVILQILDAKAPSDNHHVVNYLCGKEKIEKYDAGIVGQVQLIILDVGAVLSNIELPSSIVRYPLSGALCKRTERDIILKNISPLVLVQSSSAIVGTYSEIIEKCVYPIPISLLKIPKFLPFLGKKLAELEYDFIVYGNNISHVGLSLAAGGHAVTLFNIDSGNRKSADAAVLTKRSNCIRNAGGGRIIVREFSQAPEDMLILRRASLIVADVLHRDLISMLLNVSFDGYLIVPSYNSIDYEERNEFLLCLCHYGVVSYRKPRLMNFYDLHEATAESGALIDFSRQLIIQKGLLERSKLPMMSLSEEKCSNIMK